MQSPKIHGGEYSQHWGFSNATCSLFPSIDRTQVEGEKPIRGIRHRPLEIS